SAAIPIITIPVAVMISFIPMRMMGMTANIMSLGGIAIAIGAMVDAAIVVVEQTHKKLEEWQRTGRKEDYHTVVVNAVKEVGGQFLRAAGDCGFVPAGADAGSAGRAALQTAGLHEEFRHDRGGAAGHHARSGHAADVHPHGELPVPAALARAPPMPCWWGPFTPRRSEERRVG